MKRQFFFFAKTFCLGAFLLSCTKYKADSDFNVSPPVSNLYRVVSNSDSTLISRFVSIGSSHNDGLDYVFVRLQNNFDTYIGIQNEQSRLNAILTDIQKYAVAYTGGDYDACG